MKRRFRKTKWYPVAVSLYKLVGTAMAGALAFRWGLGFEYGLYGFEMDYLLVQGVFVALTALSAYWLVWLVWLMTTAVSAFYRKRITSLEEGFSFILVLDRDPRSRSDVDRLSEVFDPEGFEFVPALFEGKYVLDCYIKAKFLRKHNFELALRRATRLARQSGFQVHRIEVEPADIKLDEQ